VVGIALGDVPGGAHPAQSAIATTSEISIGVLVRMRVIRASPAERNT
jgi:hypothetical protein